MICDMHTPGIDVRPIETIDREQDFAEVFYDEVRIPLSNVVGEVNDGWNVAMATLSFERGTAFTAGQVRLAETVERLIGVAGAPRAVGPPHRPGRRVPRRAAGHGAGRGRGAARDDLCGDLARRPAETPGPEGSIVKLYFSELEQRVARLSMDVLGPDALRFVSKWLPGGWTGDYLRSYASTSAAAPRDPAQHHRRARLAAALRG